MSYMWARKDRPNLDDAAHTVFMHDNPSAIGWTKTNASCRVCGAKLRAFYHEARLYSVRCDKCRIVSLVEARNPYDAAEKVGKVELPFP